MRLRPEPPRVTRLSRKALAVIGGVASVGLGGALTYALQGQQGGKPAEEVYTTDGRSTPDGLNALRKDYAGPVLGPPLPGDLGRPILDAQNRRQPVPVPGIDAPASSTPPDPEAERRRQELERRRQELEAARTSRVFFQSGAATATTGGSGPGDGMPNLVGMGAPGQTAAPTTQDRQLAFLNQTADRRTVAPDRVTAPPSPFVVQAGAVIPAALVTGIRSDLPGQVTAQVTENVYDSPTGRLLLIPQGTRIVGQYDSGVGFGQRRVLLAWTRLIFPNGRSIVLERQPGADAQGYAGLEDGVDHHWWDLAKAAGLSTLLSVGAQAGGSGEQSDLARALRQGASDGISQTGRQVVGRQLDIAPTLTIRPGFPMRIIVTRDLILEPYGAVP
ncbi:TrbI/VirB10 family protein [Sphingomonas sp. S6]|uniref:TrbI/VirB10 family protein n=1 Tax=Sphingomonas sp. S6 TaxID=3368600 RepID=UPI0028ED3209|nr:TrbI/VirB10 family protein [uncultured Sphingomonas sp.]